MMVEFDFAGSVLLSSHCAARWLAITASRLSGTCVFPTMSKCVLREEVDIYVGNVEFTCNKILRLMTQRWI